MVGSSEGLPVQSPSRRKFLRAGALLGSIGLSGIARGAPGAPNLGQSRRGRNPGNPSCFLAGTKILTVTGEVRIEDLAIGDLLPTMFGGVLPIQWIGRYAFKRRISSRPWPRNARPVRIARGALAPNVPSDDLCVSQAHALLVDGVLVSAGFLVNGTTIALDEASDRDTLEFFHIKLERHDVITAEGAPAETLLSVDESAVNFVDYFRAHGMPTGEEAPCLPILSTYRQGSGLKARVRRAASWASRRRKIGAIRERLSTRATIRARETEPA